MLQQTRGSGSNPQRPAQDAISLYYDNDRSCSPFFLDPVASPVVCMFWSFMFSYSCLLGALSGLFNSKFDIFTSATLVLIGTRIGTVKRV